MVGGRLRPTQTNYNAPRANKSIGRPAPAAAGLTQPKVLDLQNLTAERLKEIDDNYKAACARFDKAESNFLAVANQKALEVGDALAIEAKQEETDDERCRRILREAKETVARSDATIASCIKTSKQSNDAMKSAQSALQNVENFKNEFNELNNQLISKIGKSIGVVSQFGGKLANIQGNQINKDKVKGQVMSNGVKVQGKENRICNCGPTGKAHLKNENCIDEE